nr:TonB-dependent receptor [Sphingomonas aracearum]
MDQYPLWQFRCNPGTVNFDFGDKIYNAAPVTECTASQLQFRQFQDFHQLNNEEIWQGKLDGTYDLGGESFVKIGGKYRHTDRSFDQDQPTWTRATPNANRWTLGQFNLGGPTVCVYPDSKNTDRCFSNGPTFDIPALRDFTNANINGALIPLDAAATLTNNTTADFSLTEKVAAGYVMANLRFGAVTVTPGLRYEHTSLDVNGFRLQNGTTIVPAGSSSDYDDWLPSVIVRVAPSSDTIFRLAYSRSLGRPDYSALSPGGSYNTAEGTASFGNPDLKPYRADNLDATAEWYFAPGGLFSVGAFAKFIQNPIFTQTTTLANQVIGGVTIPTLRTAQPFNAEKGDIIGIEAQYQQQFTFLPGALSGLGVQLTGTLTDSTLRLPTGRTSTFPQQSSFLYGAELFYQRGIVEASVAFHNTGKSLLAIGDPDYNDQYNDDLRRLDAKISVALFDNVRVFAEGQNLTDEPTRQYQGGNPDWLIQNERYGRTFYGGVSVQF